MKTSEVGGQTSHIAFIEKMGGRYEYKIDGF